MLTCTVLVHHPVPARYTRYVSIFLESIFFLSFFLNVRTKNRWTKIKSGTNVSLRSGRSPEEDRGKYTSQPWNGAYRWFRSPNVICLEQYRRRVRALQELSR
jgi:hypothetical protein